MAGTRRPGQQATIRDVARLAKVSTATVSRVLSGVDVVSGPLAKRVQTAARKLRYQPNRVARSLRARKARTIGVLIPNIQNPFFTGVVRGIEDLLQATDHTLLLGNSDENPVREKAYLDLFRAEGAGGLIIVPGLEGKRAYDELLETGVPMIGIDRFVPELQIDSVIVANAEGAAVATRHLLAVGHRRIALITGPQNVSTASERVTGYAAALADAGIPRDASLIIHAPFRMEGGYDATVKLLSLPQPPTAIFAASDIIALGTLRALQDRGLRVPEQVAVVSFDDMPWASALQPPLTAVAQPTYEMGATAARLLLARIRDPQRPLERVRLQTQLMVRASCGASPAMAAEAAAIVAAASIAPATRN